MIGQQPTSTTEFKRDKIPAPKSFTPKKSDQPDESSWHRIPPTSDASIDWCVAYYVERIGQWIISDIERFLDKNLEKIEDMNDDTPPELIAGTSTMSEAKAQQLWYRYIMKRRGDAWLASVDDILPGDRVFTEDERAVFKELFLDYANDADGVDYAEGAIESFNRQLYLNERLTPADLFPPLGKTSIPGGSRIMITGSEGVGKATLAYQWAIQLCYGIDPLTGEQLDQAVRVAIVSAEDTHAEYLSKMRMMVPGDRLTYRLDDMLHFVHIPGFKLDGTAEPETIEKLAVAARAAHVVILIGGHNMVDPQSEPNYQSAMSIIADTCGDKVVILEWHATSETQWAAGTQQWKRWPGIAVKVQKNGRVMQAREPRDASVKIPTWRRGRVLDQGKARVNGIEWVWVLDKPKPESAPQESKPAAVVEPTPEPLTFREARNSKILQLRAGGMSYQDIADAVTEQVGRVSRSTVRDVVKAAEDREESVR